MIRAWRRADGRYRLDFGTGRFGVPINVHWALRDSGAERDAERGGWIIPAKHLARFRPYEKMFGVVAGPSSCGCEPPRFRWVTESEVRKGHTDALLCEGCCYSADPPGRTIHRQCDIIDVCGEADVAEAVFDAEFKQKLYV